MTIGSRILIALLCLVAVAVLSACGDDRPPAATPTAAIALPPTIAPTSPPAPTATHTPTPTPTPTATPAPSPAATPTPTSAPTATPDPQSLPYVRWVVGDEVSPELLSNVRKGIRLMHDYAESLGMPEIEADVTVYVYRDIDKLVDAHHEVTGEPKNDIPQIPHLTLF